MPKSKKPTKKLSSKTSSSQYDEDESEYSEDLEDFVDENEENYDDDYEEDDYEEEDYDDDDDSDKSSHHDESEDDDREESEDSDEDHDDDEEEDYDDAEDEEESKAVAPDDTIEYHDGRLWFRIEGRYLVIGISQSAVDEVGSVSAIELPSDGDDFTKDDIMCEVGGSNGSIKVYSPASGFIADVNSVLSDDPGLLEQDPFDEGWIVKMEVEDPTELKEYY